MRTCVYREEESLYSRGRGILYKRGEDGLLEAEQESLGEILWESLPEQVRHCGGESTFG